MKITRNYTRNYTATRQNAVISKHGNIKTQEEDSVTTTVLRSTGTPSIDVDRHGNGAAMSAYCERRKDSSGPISGQFDTVVWQHAEDQETGYRQEPVRPISTKIRQTQRK